MNVKPRRRIKTESDASVQTKKWRYEFFTGPCTGTCRYVSTQPEQRLLDATQFRCTTHGRLHECNGIQCWRLGDSKDLFEYNGEARPQCAWTGKPLHFEFKIDFDVWGTYIGGKGDVRNTTEKNELEDRGMYIIRSMQRFLQSPIRKQAHRTFLDALVRAPNKPRLVDFGMPYFLDALHIPYDDLYAFACACACCPRARKMSTKKLTDDIEIVLHNVCLRSPGYEIENLPWWVFFIAPFGVKWPKK